MERHTFEMAIEELPHGVLPFEGAFEVPRGFAQAMHALGGAGSAEAGRIRDAMQPLQEKFLTAYALAAFPGIEDRWTTEERLVELGLPAEKPTATWDFDDF